MSGCGHRTVHQSDLCHMNVVFRKLLRMVVGTPGNLDWSRPWHGILHEWSMTIVSEHQVKLWSHRCLESYWYVLTGGSKEPRIGNLPVHVLQDIFDMTGYQNFNRRPGIGRRMIGTHWHPTRNCGHTWRKISLFCFRPGPMRNNEHFVGNFHQFFPSSRAQYRPPTGIPDEPELVRFRNQWNFLIYLLPTNGFRSGPFWQM